MAGSTIILERDLGPLKFLLHAAIMRFLTYANSGSATPENALRVLGTAIDSEPFPTSDVTGHTLGPAGLHPSPFQRPFAPNPEH